MPAPLQCEPRPRLISKPVANPVVRADIDEATHVAVEQRGDVVRRTAHHVEGPVEPARDVFRTRGERGNVHAEERLHLLLVELFGNLPGERSAP